MSTNWLHSEDVQLCISYCRQSIDPISGSKQKIDKLWEKIHVDYQQNWERSSGETRVEPRSRNSLASRFAKLKPNLSYWGASLAFARRNPQSGANLHDELRKAQTFYVSKMKKEFKHFECWEIVMSHPTFQVTEPSTPPTYRSHSEEETPPMQEVPTTVNLEETQGTTRSLHFGGSSTPPRPIGVKAAKEAKRKGKQAVTPTNEARDDILKTIAGNQKSWQDFQKTRLETVSAHEEKLYKLRALEEETKVMTMNMEAMTPNTKRYFTKRKADILNRLDDNGGEDNDSLFSNCYRPDFSD